MRDTSFGWSPITSNHRSRFVNCGREGFEVIRVFDFEGTERPADTLEIDQSVHVHYIAVKPRRDTSRQ
jgi:hypothetical protein